MEILIALFIPLLFISFMILIFNESFDQSFDYLVNCLINSKANNMYIK